MSPVSNGPMLSMRHFNRDAMGSNNIDLVPSTGRLSLLMHGAKAGPPSTSNVLLDVVVLPGKLRIVIETPPQGGCTYVCEIKDSFPVRGNMRLKVDNKDVQRMNTVKLSKVLARKSGNAVRKMKMAGAGCFPVVDYKAGRKT